MPNTLLTNGNIQLAVVTGGHTFQVPAFHHMLRSLPGVDYYPQTVDDFTADDKMAAAYDVVLFYTMYQFSPGQELPWYQASLFSTLEKLGRAGQGILMLHHSLVAFPDWPLWSELVGMENRRNIATHLSQEVPIQIVDPVHPINRGIGSWTLRDETYEMASPRVEDGNHLLLTTTHERSISAIGWTRTFRDSRVFCWQSGHDETAYDDASFRQILGNAIHWLGQKPVIES